MDKAHLAATASLIFGGAVVVSVLATGSLHRPVTAYEWGSVFGFGTGIFAALVGGTRLAFRDAPLELLCLVLAVAIAGVVTYNAPKAPEAMATAEECNLAYQQILAIARAENIAPSVQGRIMRFRSDLILACESALRSEVRCVMAATDKYSLMSCLGYTGPTN